MKQAWYILFLLISIYSYSTPELRTWSYVESNVKINRQLRYKDECRDLFFKTLTNELNKFVLKGIKNGTIQDRFYLFEINDAIWTEKECGIDVTRFKRGARVILNGLHQKITYEYLSFIISYYSKPNWESFCYDMKSVKPQNAIKIFNRKVGWKELIGKDFIVDYDMPFGKVVMCSDSLFIRSNSGDSDALNSILPLTSNNYQIAITTKGVLIYSSADVKSFFDWVQLKGTNIYYEGFEVNVYSDWLNIKTRGETLLSYCFSKNKFYDLTKPTK